MVMPAPAKALFSIRYAFKYSPHPVLSRAAHNKLHFGPTPPLTAAAIRQEFQAIPAGPLTIAN
jgi:hypothetical protein